MSEANQVGRRGFLGSSVAALAAGSAALGGEPAKSASPASPAPVAKADMPYGMLGKAKISRLMLGGNLVSGYMHSRDLAYVGPLFRAYVTEQKIFETFRLAEEQGINTVFESGINFVQRYNKEFGGRMQIIPSIHPELTFDEAALKREVQRYVDAGVPAIYVWGVAGDTLAKSQRIDILGRAVEIAKKSGLPVGVGAHSLTVPVECEKALVPCDFYVKTLHRDDYPSATPKELRKDYMWIDGGKGFYDNMWCINAEETVEFMKTVTKPWVAFKVLAAGAINPQQGFAHAFRSGADFIAVGMFDFQIRQNSELVQKVIRREQDRPRPWRA
jgi:hypothetical protein